MPRIKIDLPSSFPFATDIPLYVSHINYGNHLDNAQLLGIVSEARARFFKSMGYTELSVEGSVGIVVADAAAQYRSEAFYGETLVVSMGASDFSPFGCDLVWQLKDKATGREVARGKTGIIFFDYATRSKAPVPTGFLTQTGQ